MLKQLIINVLIRTISNTSTLIDRILKINSEKVVQAGIVETFLSDHQLIFCTIKVKIAKPKKHNYLTFCSMKNFSSEIYKEALGMLKCLHYENFSCVNKAYSDQISNVLM